MERSNYARRMPGSLQIPRYLRFDWNNTKADRTFSNLCFSGDTRHESQVPPSVARTCMVTVGGSASNWNSMPPDPSKAAARGESSFPPPPIASLMIGRWLR